MKKNRYKIVILISLFIFMFSISFYTTPEFNNKLIDLETSTNNYLFNGKEYDITLDDVYDDENYTKIYTGANFQSVFLENESILLNETVSNVNNTNYKSPNLGDYPATYNFTNDNTGSNPEGWDDYSGAGCTAQVIASEDGHKKVLDLHDQSGTESSHIEQSLADITSGVIEFWFQITLGNQYTTLRIYDGGTECITVQFGYSTDWLAYYNGTHTITILHLSLDTWYHIKLDFDCTTDTYDIVVDGVLEVDDAIFRNTGVGLDKIRFLTQIASTNHHFYIDAIGYSWDPEYTPSEHHAGTYSFTNEPNSETGTDIDFADSISGSGTIEIQDNKSLHNKILYLKSTNSAYTWAENEFISSQNSGTVEIWQYAVKDDIDWSCRVIFLDSSGNQAYTYLNSADTYGWYDGTSGTTLDTGFSNKWNHLKFTWSGNNMDVSVNGGTNIPVLLKTGQTSVSKIRVLQYDDEGEMWIDAIGYSWDSNYDIGDNLNPSLGNTMPVGLEMLNGTFDNTDNMKANDDSYSSFISEGEGSAGEQFLDDVGYSGGAYLSGTIEGTHTDDSNKLVGKSSSGGTLIMNLLFDPSLSGGDYEISIHSKGSTNSLGDVTTSHDFLINDVVEESGDIIDFDDVEYSGVNTIKIKVLGSPYLYRYLHLYYIKIVAIVDSPELNFTIDLNFNEVDTSKLLALDVSSYHYTNVSTDIVGNIYDYNSGTYTEMFNSSYTTETENYFMDNSSVSNYLNSSGNLRIQFKGTNSESNFNLTIDYIKVRFYYKMDLTHTISFETNGLWKYRWEIFGSLHYTDWTYFEVIDPDPNFQAISESEVTTRWILQNSTLSPVEDFHDDINTAYWNFINSSSISFTENTSLIEDAEVRSDQSTTNYGSANNFGVYYDGAKDHRTFIKVSTNYLTANASDDTNLRVYQWFPSAEDTDIRVNESGSFDESTITWNSQPTADVFVDETAVSSSIGWKNINLSTGFNMYYMLYAYVSVDWQAYYSSEAGSNNPIITHNLYKNYFGDGYMYMQTDKTESIALKSEDYGTHKTLSSGDYFEVDFQTNSDSKVELILLKDGVVNATLVLSPSGNSDFTRHTSQISIDETVEFDQLKISSTFEDQDYIKVWDVKTFKYAIVGDYADFLVGSNRDYSVYLTPDTYNLRISEEGDEKINENITISATGVLQYVYTPIERLECRIALFNTVDESLEFTDYHIKVNRSLNDVYNEFWLLDSIFSADKETNAYISIYDRFDTLIDTFERLTSDYIDLELEVYKLQIKNLMEQKTTVDINSSFVFPLLSGELIEYILAKDYYEIGYYNTNNNYTQFTIYLNSNQAYELNRSKLCFLSFADQQGNHLSFDNYKTYINGSMIYENIFYEDAGDDVNITITDRYDYQVYSTIYSVDSGNNFIPITLTMYSLKVMNQQELFNWINISRDPNYYESEYYWSEWIAPNEIIEFRLFAGYYKINLTDNEGSSYSFYAYTLSGDDILLISSDNIISNVIYNIENVNASIGNQITNVQIDLTNQNSDINNTIVNIEINLDSVNSSLDLLLINQNTQLDFISNNISEIFIWMDSNFTSLQNNITTSFIDLSTDVYLINDSIYTSVIGIDASLSIINTTISGNMSLAIQQNEFLTSLFQLTMFSDLLNWSSASFNSSFIENQIDVWSFVNDYRNTSAIVELLYEGVVDELVVSAQATEDQYLPATDVEYRVWSVEDEEYLDEWQPLPENRTVDFGFYEAEISPEPFDGTLLMIVFGAFVIATVGYLILLRTNLKFQKKTLFSVPKKPIKKVNLNKNVTDKSWKKDLESET